MILLGKCVAYRPALCLPIVSIHTLLGSVSLVGDEVRVVVKATLHIAVPSFTFWLLPFKFESTTVECAVPATYLSTQLFPLRKLSLVCMQSLHSREQCSGLVVQ